MASQIATDVYKTEKPISERGMSTFRTIAARLSTFAPPIFIERHIAEEQTPRGKFSTLEAHDSTLDGINFVAPDPKLLAKAFHKITDQWGNPALTSMREDPGHWALKASFGKTVGTGWREPWRPVPRGSSASVPKETGAVDNLFRMRFGDTGTPIRFTALHCAVDEIGGRCNIHIDESGFVLALPEGVSLTPDMYDHVINELLLKTDFRDWLVGKLSNETAKTIVKEVIQRLAFQFPNAANGYAGLAHNINSIRRPGGAGEFLLTAARTLGPTGVTFDVFTNDNVKVQVTGTQIAGDRTISITLGGTW
jgi:hypothetical protein